MAVTPVVALETLLRSLLALAFLCAGATLGRAMLTRLRGRPGGPLTLRLAGTLLCSVWLCSAAFHVLAAFRRFDLGGAAALCALGLLLARRSSRSAARALSRDVSVVARWTRSTLPRRPITAALAAAAVISGLRALVVPPSGWDSLTYHLPKAALWLQTAGGRLPDGPGGWSYYRLFPGGGEVLWAWTMLPLHTDGLVGLVDVGLWVALALATYRLGRELRLQPAASALAALSVVATPAALTACGTAYVDNPAHAFWVLALAFVLRAAKGEASALPLTGAALGLAAGTKLTALPQLSVFALAMLLLAACRRRERRLLRGAVLALALAATAWLPWPLQALHETGLPLSPYPVRVGSLRLGGNAEHEWYLSQRVGHPYSLPDEAVALGTVLDTPLGESLGVFAVPPLLLLPLGIVRMWRRHRAAAAVATIVVVDAAAFYWSPGFSAVRLGWAPVNARFLLTLLAVASTVGFHAVGRARGAYVALLAFGSAFNLWVYGGLSWTRLEVERAVYQALALAAAAVVAAAAVKARRGRAPWLAASASLFVAQAVLAQQAGRQDVLAASLEQRGVPRYWAPAARAVDVPSVGRRIAVTSGPLRTAHNWFWYPFFGSRLQNVVLYVPPTPSGASAVFASPDYEGTTDRVAWLRRLDEAGVDSVMCFAPRSPELAWMEADGARFRRAYGDGRSWGLFVVRR